MDWEGLLCIGGLLKELSKVAVTSECSLVLLNCSYEQ